MQFEDWFDTGIKVLIGMFLGFVTDTLAQMATTAFWPVAVILAFIFLFELIFDKLTDRLFLSKVRESNHANRRGSKPLLRKMSLPAGVLFGVVLAELRLDGTNMARF